jgi:hypothetical protein
MNAPMPHEASETRNNEARNLRAEKENSMVHDVTFRLPERQVGNADIEIAVREDGDLLGTLGISKGALLWMPANKRKGFTLEWTTFDRLAREHGRKTAR